MRAVFLAALLGVGFSVSPGAAQSSGGQSGNARYEKRAPNATDGLFENGPERPHALAEAKREEAAHSTEAPKTQEPGPTKPSTPAPIVPTVQAVAPGPPQKDLTGNEFKLIRTGSTVKQVLNILGPPSSRVVVPDDDDHLRETLEYWVKGVPAATIRLVDGRVVKIETNLK